MNRIQEFRDEKGWSQEQLADRINDVLEAKPELKKINMGNMPDEGYFKSIKNEKE